MNPVAHRRFFDNLPDFERARYSVLLLQLRKLRLPCRCERLGGQDFQVVVGYGLPTAQYWLDMYGIADEEEETLPP